MLTAAILTHNDEHRLESCIKFLNFCDEIVIVDDQSTDNTVKIAKKLNAKVDVHPLENDFAAQRNRLLEKARGEWILFIDSDEEVTTELANEIIATLKEPKYDVYFIKREDFFQNHKMLHGEVQTAAKKGFIRLVKKGSGTWKGSVHEEFKTNKETGDLIHPLKHYPHQSISEFIADINFYSTLRAKQLLKEKHIPTITELLFLPTGKFFYTYILKQGFKDKTPGLIYSFMMSFHSFLVRAKLYQYTQLGE